MLSKLNKNIFIGLIIIIVISLLVFLNYNDRSLGNSKEMNEFILETNDKSSEPDNIKLDQIVVDVKGEVNSPGVYEIQPDARVHHVIDLAGGFTNHANKDVVNLAQRVHDEMVVFVPPIGEGTDVTYQDNHVDNKKIRINYASQEEIEQLSGIGPKKANAIIQYRDEHGFFQSVEDLLNISGIGEKTLENMKDEIQIP